MSKDDEKGNKSTFVTQLREGPISMSIFQREGKDGPVFNGALRNNWQDKNGDWQSNSNFSEYDLQRIKDSKLIDKTLTYIVGLRHEQELIRETEVQEPVAQQTAPQPSTQNQPQPEPTVEAARSQYQDVKQPQEQAPAQSPEQTSTHNRNQRREAPRER